MATGPDFLDLAIARIVELAAQHPHDPRHIEVLLRQQWGATRQYIRRSASDPGAKRDGK